MTVKKLLAECHPPRPDAGGFVLVCIALLFSAFSAQAATATYTASGTWTAPAGVTSVDVEVWGGGGGGGGQNNNADGGGGGGGGAYSKSTIAVTPGNTYTVTVGAGGAGGTGGTGVTGGDSYFINAATVMAKGGTGGAPSTGTPPPGGAGGAAAAGVGTTRFSGGNGGAGRNNSTGQGGPGGSSAGTGANGASGPTTWSTVTAAAAPAGGGIGGNGGTSGNNGSAPASGNGGGGGGSGDGANRTGGSGADGQVILTYVVPFACSPPSNTPAGLSLSCVCDTFNRATLNPSTIFGANWIVSTSDATGILPSIVNSGALRLTNNTGNNAKAATVPGIFPAAGNYISVEFQQYAYNGSGADGIAVTLSDYAIPAVPGAYGGSLGYAQETGIHDGFAGGWLGVGLDEYGNYQNTNEGRLGGPGFTTESVGARGSGSGQTGYRWLGGTGSLTPKIDNNTSTTRSLGFYYQVIVDARNDPASTAIAINRDTGGGYVPLITIPNVYTAATAQGFTQAPVPTNWQISFTGSTGGSTNIHEIGGLRICAQTVVPTSGGTAGDFNAVDEAYGTPPLAVQNYLSGHIYTKLVGASFKLNVAALSNGQLVTTYAASSNKTVTVKLVDNSDSLTNSSLDCTLTCTSTCTGKAAVAGGTQSLTFVSTDKGQKQSAGFTVNSAYQKLVAIISDGTTTGCSTDAFSVRPQSIASVASSNATYTTTTGTPILAAGSGNFSLTATTAGVAGSLSNYTGVLKFNSTQVATVALPSAVTGTLTGTFPAATSGTPSSTATGAAFTYSEVGGFTLPIYSVYDGVVTAVDCSGMTTAQCDTLKASTWTGVDSISTKGDCNADSFSNARDASGKYGCNFGNPVVAGPFGRFVPDHFDTVVKYDTGSKIFMPCPAGLTCPASGDLANGNGFVYSGQPFSTQVTARNAAGAPTLNYNSTTTLSKTVTLSAYDAAGGAVANPPGGNGALANNSVPPAAFSAGVAIMTNTPTYAFTTVPAVPTDIFVRAVDADNVSSLRATAPASVEGGIKVVSGRINIPSVHGSELLPLPVVVTAQYWVNAASGWVTSSTDSVSSFAASSVSFTNCQKLSATSTWPTTCPPPTLLSPASVVFVNGVGSFKLSAPGAGNTGSVDIATSVPGYLPSNKGHAAFGVYKGASEFIYLRENY